MKRKKKPSTTDRGWLDDELRFLGYLEAETKGTKAKRKTFADEAIRDKILAEINGGASLITALWHLKKGVAVLGLQSTAFAERKKGDGAGWLVKLNKDLAEMFEEEHGLIPNGGITIEVGNHSAKAIAEWAAETIMLFHSSFVRMAIEEDD